MAFSEGTEEKAFERSRGQCECCRTSHDHDAERCARTISRHGAEYYHVTSEFAGGSDDLSNCEVLCVACYKLTGSYGSH
jgi:hypothetical protein